MDLFPDHLKDPVEARRGSFQFYCGGQGTHTTTSTQKYPVHTSQRVTGQSKLISFTEQLISLDEEQNYLTFFS